MSEQTVAPLDVWRTRGSGSWGVRAVPALSLLAGIALWEVAARQQATPFLAPPSAVVPESLRLLTDHALLGDLFRSLTNLVVGYALAVVTGVGVGLAIGRRRMVDYALAPIVSAMLASPKLLFVPVLYAVFGVSRSAQVAVIFLSAVFIIIVNTATAVRSVDPATVEMARAFGANSRQMFWRVLLPGSVPLMMAGLRLGMGRAVSGMIAGEMFITLFGLGARLRVSGNRFDGTGVMAVLAIVVTVAMISSSLVRLAERRLTRWTLADD